MRKGWHQETSEEHLTAKHSHRSPVRLDETCRPGTALEEHFVHNAHADSSSKHSMGTLESRPSQPRRERCAAHPTPSLKICPLPVPGARRGAGSSPRKLGTDRDWRDSSEGACTTPDSPRMRGASFSRRGWKLWRREERRGPHRETCPDGDVRARAGEAPRRRSSDCDWEFVWTAGGSSKLFSSKQVWTTRRNSFVGADSVSPKR
jgi:hypothetical protein